LRIVLIALKGKMSMHEHKTAARLSIQTIAGHILLRLRDRTVDLPAGRLIVLDQGVPHDVESKGDSAVLLTLSWPGEEIGKAAPDQAKND
jgi:quercetin dioxygenase-like cupin family protein